MILLWQHVPWAHAEARQAWLWEHEQEHRALAAQTAGLASGPLDDLFVQPMAHDAVHRQLAEVWQTPGADFASVNFDDPVQWALWHQAHALEHYALHQAAGLP